MLQPAPRPPAPVLGADAWREVLASNLPTIRRVVHSICRRHRENRELEDELFSEVCLKLLEHDCAVLRQFRGECRLATYLRTVTCRVLLDQRVRAWGKWRPTARARALGDAAVAFERLIARDRLTRHEAINALSTGSAISSIEAQHLSASIRPRHRTRVVALDRLPDVADQRAAHSLPVVTHLRRRSASVRSALARALNELSPGEVDLLRWRYCDGRTVAEIARATGREQKRLYRRYDLVHHRLRLALEDAGVGAGDVSDLIGHAVVDLGGVLPAADTAA